MLVEMALNQVDPVPANSSFDDCITSDFPELNLVKQEYYTDKHGDNIPDYLIKDKNSSSNSNKDGEQILKLNNKQGLKNTVRNKHAMFRKTIKWIYKNPLTDAELQKIADEILLKDLPLDNGVLTDIEDDDDDNVENFFENEVFHPDLSEVPSSSTSCTNDNNQTEPENNSVTDQIENNQSSTSNNENGTRRSFRLESNIFTPIDDKMDMCTNNKSRDKIGMSFLSKLFLLFATIAVGYLGVKLFPLCKPPILPVLDENAYWGPGNAPVKQDTSIRPFKISVPDEVLEDLRHRLETDRPYTPPLENIQQQYGFNTNLLKEIVEYWKTKYNWRERETFLNQFPQYKTKIQGLDIHYLHIKPKVPSNVKVIPLLILHGWPGSVREFYEIIPFLTQINKERGFVFEVIAPSLPGYGFSQAASKPGMGSNQIAMILKNLMKRIGFDKFYVQGGDWGSIVVTDMAVLFPKNVLGLHSNFCSLSSLKSYLKLIFGSFYPPWVIDKQHEDKMYPLLTKFTTLIQESGYFHIQATKPDTVGIAIGQSPSGLAAYVLEKFSTGTNFTYREREDGGLKEKFNYNQLLDNVMIYWLTNSFTTAIRLYAEGINREVTRMPIDEEVPCACARMGQEIVYYTDWMLRDRYQNLVQATDYDVGGHFAAMEVPEILAKDIFMAVATMEKLRNSK
ncbi:hypothetical protein RN001_009994 [Aquatica leii]|uniref:Epoxide hydrolase N-terminal domain-containing protein n=1 Tax=Aquatica leii TaxID=1421715 RepID=A0AAN7QH63_9COLE|nr:hypothetical protein RN001_009994 [Aquatica leii]